mmetsp:Transcript_19366/g.53874  ORF Transcript_19366/g.53874 Transcript_19366/m.53874 type:complete len:200 (-) Transcript_19366:14-613(-)
MTRWEVCGQDLPPHLQQDRQYDAAHQGVTFAAGRRLPSQETMHVLHELQAGQAFCHIPSLQNAIHRVGLVLCHLGLDLLQLFAGHTRVAFADAHVLVVGSVIHEQLAFLRAVCGQDEWPIVVTPIPQHIMQSTGWVVEGVHSRCLLALRHLVDVTMNAAACRFVQLARLVVRDIKCMTILLGVEAVLLAVQAQHELLHH